MVRALVALTCVGGLSFAMPVKAQPDPAEWAPADSAFYVGFPDVTSFERAIRLFPADGGSEARPGDAAGAGEAMQRHFRQRFARLLGTRPEELRNPLGGPLCAVLVPIDDGRLRPVIRIGIADATLARDYYEKAVANLQRVARYERVPAGATQIDWFQVADAKSADAPAGIVDPPDPPDTFAAWFAESLDGLLTAEDLPPRLATCLLGDQWVIATDPRAIAHVIGVERNDTLATREELAAARSAEAPPPSVRFYWDLARMFDRLDPAHAAAKAELLALGGACLRSISGFISLDKDGVGLRAEAVVRMAEPAVGLAKVLRAANRPTEHGSVPGALLLAEWNGDMNPAVDEVQSVLRAVDPDLADQMERDLGQVSLPGGGAAINLRRDVIAHLRPPFRLAAALGGAPGAIAVGLFARHADRSTLARSASTIREAFALTPPPSGGGEGFWFAPLNLGLTLSDEDLAITLGGAPSAGSPTLGVPRGLPDWPALRRVAPAEASAWVFIDDGQFARRLSDVERRSPSNAGETVAVQIVRSVAGAIGGSSADGSAAGGTCRFLALTTVPEGIRFTFVRLAPDGPGAPTSGDAK